MSKNRLKINTVEKESIKALVLTALECSDWSRLKLVPVFGQNNQLLMVSYDLTIAQYQQPLEPGQCYVCSNGGSIICPCTEITAICSDCKIKNYCSEKPETGLVNCGVLFLKLKPDKSEISRFVL